MTARTKGRPEDMEYIIEFRAKIAAIDEKRALLTRRTRGGFRAEPTVSASGLIVGNVDFQLYHLDSYSGLPTWSYSCQGQLMESAMVRGTSVWQLDKRGCLHHVQAERGEGHLVASGVEQVIAASDVHVIYKLGTGDMVMRHRDNQRVVSVEGVPTGEGMLISDDTASIMVWLGAGGKMIAYALSSDMFVN